MATMDLAEAPRILGGGAGLGGADDFALLTDVAAALGASMGATRVVTDAGWVGHERQIGTTGVVVDPRLYVAFGISGAVQHTSGLGDPQHMVSVNLDPHCPMMALADLAVVADASAVLRALAGQLGLSTVHATCLRTPRGRMGTMPDFDVVVVGAGPAGSSAALVLARAGRKVCLARARPVPRRRRTCTAGWSTAASSTP